jgi:VWFA-related protein
MARLGRGAVPIVVGMVLGAAAAGQPPAPSPRPAQPPPAQTAPAEPPAAQPAPQSEPAQPPVFRAGVNFVRVDVIVTDRAGNPITDLGAADFEVFEDGVPQTIETFRLVRVGQLVEPGAAPAPIRTAADQEREAAREDVRLIAIFLDDYHVRRGAALRVREPLVNFIRTALAPTDLVAVMYPLTPLGEVTFTRDHEAVVRAIQQFNGRKWDYEPLNEFEMRYAQYPASVVEVIRNQVSLSALKGLVTHLGGLREGRKAVILVSEGYSNYLPPQLRDPIATMPGVGNPARGQPSAGEWDPREQVAQFFANADLLSDLRSVYDAANRNNAAIYALDPRGLAPFEFDINQAVGTKLDAELLRATQDTLRTLAEETDGRAIVNQNDLERGLRQLVRDASAYYLLGYNSTQAPADGKFHQIQVRVKRRGVQVRARKGYWALTAEEAARAVAPAKPGPPPEVTAALAAVATPSRGRLVRTWIGTARGPDGRTRVTFVWEPVPPPPGVRADLPARVSLVAAAPDGTPWFRGRVPEVALATTRPPAAVAAGAAGPVRTPVQVSFDAAPGPLRLRIAVEGAADQVLDTEVRELRVPDFTAPQVALSTPAVFRAQNAFEWRALVADPTAVPVAGREFRRTDRLLVRFEAYGPGGTAPSVAARLLNRSGQRMADLSVASPDRATYQIDLPLATLPNGEYLVEVTATADDATARELVAFRVTS